MAESQILRVKFEEGRELIDHPREGDVGEFSVADGAADIAVHAGKPALPEGAWWDGCVGAQTCLFGVRSVCGVDAVIGQLPKSGDEGFALLV